MILSTAAEQLIFSAMKRASLPADTLTVIEYDELIDFIRDILEDSPSRDERAEWKPTYRKLQQQRERLYGPRPTPPRP